MLLGLQFVKNHSCKYLKEADLQIILSESLFPFQTFSYCYLLYHIFINIVFHLFIVFIILTDFYIIMPCTASYYLYWINIPDVTFIFFFIYPLAYLLVHTTVCHPNYSLLKISSSILCSWSAVTLQTLRLGIRINWFLQLQRSVVGSEWRSFVGHEGWIILSLNQWRTLFVDT